MIKVSFAAFATERTAVSYLCRPDGEQQQESSQSSHHDNRADRRRRRSPACWCRENEEDTGDAVRRRTGLVLWNQQLVRTTTEARLTRTITLQRMRSLQTIPVNDAVLHRDVGIFEGLDVVELVADGEGNLLRSGRVEGLKPNLSLRVICSFEGFQLHTDGLREVLQQLLHLRPQTEKETNCWFQVYIYELLLHIQEIFQPTYVE